MTDVTPFNFDGSEVRIVLRDGEPWFVANDVATALGYANTFKAAGDHVDDEDRDDFPIRDAIGRTQRTTVINESGLYALIFGSRLEAAKRFKRWVTSEVLPAIRRHGRYDLAPASHLDVAENILRALREDERRIAAIEQRQDVSDERQHVIESKLTEALGNYSEFTTLGYANLRGLPTDRSYLIRLGQHAAALMRADGNAPRKREDVSFGKINVYPVAYLDRAAPMLA